MPDMVGTREILTFRLGVEEYGIDLLKVREIRGYDTVTRIANAPDFIKGVADLRGTSVPIIDLRIRFSVGRAEYDQCTAVIILNLSNRVVGVVVDSIADVLSLSSDHVRPASESRSVVDTRYVNGIGVVDERRLILVDIERLMASADMGLVDDAAAER